MAEIQRQPIVEGPAAETAEAEWTPAPGTGVALAAGAATALVGVGVAAKFESGMNLAPSDADYHKAQAQPHNGTPPMEHASEIQAATIFGPAVLVMTGVALVARARQRANR